MLVSVCSTADIHYGGGVGVVYHCLVVVSYLGPRYIALSHSLSLLETTNVKMSRVKLSTLQCLLLSKVRV